MEQVNDRLDRIKCYVLELLNEMGLAYHYYDGLVEELFEQANYPIINPYKTALLFTDMIIGNTSATVSE